MNIYYFHTPYGETTAPCNYIQDIIIEESGAGKEEKQPKNVSFADISAPDYVYDASAREKKQAFSSLTCAAPGNTNEFALFSA